MSTHKTVLLQETIEGLNLPERAVVIDSTFGGGGHSREIFKRQKDARVVALDTDATALERAHGFEGCDIRLVNENFRNLEKAEVREVDGIIFDLGLSSDQLTGNSGRGFSFMHDEPLIMTLKANPSPEDITAHDVVNHWSEESLIKIIRGYGEERYARRIAKAIVQAREKAEIKSSLALGKIISDIVPAVYRKGHAKGRASKIHPATRTFQAIRIAVNDELGALTEGLKKSFEFLKIGGRLAVISFHSLEDRVVKRFYKKMVGEGRAKLVNKKIITASETELKENPRARSAKLRILEKVK